MILCPSLMCSDIGNLKKELIELENSEVDIMHLDIMDGHFVPNLGLSMNTVEYICKNTNIECDAHLMVNNPLDYIERLHEYGCKLIYLHPETDQHICRTLQMIRSKKIKTGIVIGPQYPTIMFEEFLSLVDYILIMTVNPGFAGQKYLSFVDNKIKELVNLKKQYDFKIILDGSCSRDVIKRNYELGVDGFVLGTAALFNQNNSYAHIINSIREENSCNGETKPL